MGYNQDLYQQVILDHNKKPRNYREMPEATHQCDGHNPLCGDHITVFVRVSGEGIIEELTFQGNGCAISKSSASLMTEFLKGKSREEVKIIFEEFHGMVLGEFDPTAQDHHLGKLKLFQGVKEYPSRIKCASLSWHALMCALDKKVKTSTE